VKDVNEYMKDLIFEQLKYKIFHIFIYIPHFYGYITNSQSDQLPDEMSKWVNEPLWFPVVQASKNLQKTMKFPKA